MSNVEILLESLQIDSRYRPDLVEVSRRIEESIARRNYASAASLLSQVIKNIQDGYDYSSDGGERPWNGAAAWMEEAQAEMEHLQAMTWSTPREVTR